jgi:hypothetical protein
MSIISNRIKRLEDRLNINTQDELLSRADYEALGLEYACVTLSEFSGWCLAAMENDTATIYHDVDYSQEYAESEIPDNVVADIEALSEVPETTKTVVMQSVQHPQSWACGEPRTSDDYDYD